MRVDQAIRATSDNLSACGVDEARLLSEYLLAEIVNVERMRLPLHFGRPLTQTQSAQLAALGARLEQHEPLQYVLGYTEFCGRRFNTDRRALIPRSETEELVGHVLHTASLWNLKRPRIADVGTGSGCIALTLAIEHPQAEVLAIDKCRRALELARENAALHRVDTIEWIAGNLLEPLSEHSLDAVVSNPPYIQTEQIALLDRNVRQHEPSAALDGGEDGLDLIRELLAQSARILRTEGWIFMEIGDEQGDAVESLMRDGGYSNVAISQDLAGHDRIASGRLGQM